jgi:hypothetical protein
VTLSYNFARGSWPASPERPPGSRLQTPNPVIGAS